MAYIPNVRITQPNLYKLVFEDVNFLSAVPSVLTSMTAQITSSDTTTIDATINLVTAGFAVDSQVATITNEDLGLEADETIPDDKYTIVYTYEFTGSESGDDNITSYWVTTGEIENYIYEQLTTISQEFFVNNPMRSQFVNDLLSAYVLIKALKVAGVNGYDTEYSNILDKLSSLTILKDYIF